MGIFWGVSDLLPLKVRSCPAPGPASGPAGPAAACAAACAARPACAVAGLERCGVNEVGRAEAKEAAAGDHVLVLGLAQGQHLEREGEREGDREGGGGKRGGG